jgi:hypothetical protein
MAQGDNQPVERRGGSEVGPGHLSSVASIDVGVVRFERLRVESRALSSLSVTIVSPILPTIAA